MRLAILAATSIAVSISAYGQDLLPLNDGIFVTDARLCAMEMQDMFEAYGDLVAVASFSLAGRRLTNNYDTSCETTNIRQTGTEMNFDLHCSGEGEEWAETKRFIVDGKDKIEDQNYRTYLRCGSELTREANSPSTLVAIERWHAANSDCRGSTDNETSLLGCGARDAWDEVLESRGWCYTQPNWIGAQNLWHVCLEDLQLSLR